MHRSKSDVDEITSCLQLALSDAVFDHKAFHRFESGDLKPRHFKSTAQKKKSLSSMRNNRSTVMKECEPCPPMEISEQTKSNLGKVGVSFSFFTQNIFLENSPGVSMRRFTTIWRACMEWIDFLR
jgi:hypothetical protein